MKRLISGFASACIALLLSGCVPTMYIDSALPSATKADVAAPASPQPVQLLYEFQTRGSANARATEFTREKVMNVVKESGVFSAVSVEPQGNQRRLTVTINNFPVTEDAAARGFATGLTFGIVGTSVTDGYDCRAVLTVPGSEPVILQYKHAIHSTLGNAKAPAGLTPEASIQDAITKLVNQLTWSIMRDVAKSNRL